MPGEPLSDQPPQAPVMSSGEFRVGRVLSLALEILIHNFPKFFLIAVITIAPGALFVFVGGVRIYTFFGIPITSTSLATNLAGRVGSFVLPVVSLCLVSLSQAVTLHGVIQILRRGEFSLGRAFTGGLRRTIPIVGLTVCWIAAVYFGFLLLIVPGLMWITRFYVAVPACVVEGLGPIRSLGRSGELTKGHRWKLFGILLLVFAVGWIGSVVNVAFSVLGTPVAALALGYVWTAVYTPFHSIVIAVVYHDLRVLKDGIDIDRIAAVFD